MKHSQKIQSLLLALLLALCLVVEPGTAGTGGAGSTENPGESIGTGETDGSDESGNSGESNGDGIRPLCDFDDTYVLQ